MFVKKSSNDIVDAVIIWVDGNDPDWQAQMSKYRHETSADDRIVRYRDMGFLKYLFRGIEMYAPWIRMIHFITCGQKPEWLNCNAPKLHLISHSDYIPAEYLPTFNSHTIELNFHRIEELSERFVYFNDDHFLISETAQDDFFHNGLPRQSASFMPTYLDKTDVVFRLIDKIRGKKIGKGLAQNGKIV